MQDIIIQPIGIIYTPFHDPVAMPIQPEGGKGVKGTVEIYPKYIPCLKDLNGFSHIILIYQFHKSKDYTSEVKPFMDNELRGVFSTRAPRRPNPIGLSVVRLMKIERGILHIEDLDILNETPLLDIKPYIPKIDSHSIDKLGWMTGKVENFSKTRSDDWFK